MVAYDLTDPLEFVGCESTSTGLQVRKLSNKDKANPSNRSFAINATIGSGSSQFTELKVFNGTVPASSIPILMADLRDQNLWVNRDGYCYIRIPGRSNFNSNQSRPAKFMRLNDLFNWKDYVDVPSNQTFTPMPSTTVWNRQDSTTNQTKVDYEKLDADLKQAKDDKKKAEDDLKNAKHDLKKKAEDDLKKKAEDELEQAKTEYEDKLKTTKEKYEDTLQEVRKQKREMDEWMERLKENWANAARVGARPLPPSAFYISSTIPRPYSSNRESLSTTWMGEMQKRLSDPGSYMGSIGTGSIEIQNAVNGYGNEGFETHFWWVVQLDGLYNGVYGIIIAFEGAGRYPFPTDQFKFNYISVVNYVNGVLDLPGIGYRNLIILRHATRGTIEYDIPSN